MQDFTQDRLIQSEKFVEFNIAYPIYITSWEIRLVQDINKLYARVFYKKLIDNAKAAKVKLTCISEFGENIQEEIKAINDIDKKSYDFFEIYPLHKDTRKIKVCVIQGLCSDGKNVADAQLVMISNTFVPFSREIEYAAGQRLIASAKGYPRENDNSWICCCGSINAMNSDRCVVCKSEKTNVFSKITEENIKKTGDIISAEREEKKEREAQRLEEQKVKRKKRNKLMAILSGCCAVAIILFCSLYFPLAPLGTVDQDGMEFTKTGEHYVVTDYTGNDTTVMIPDEVRGVQVTEIGYAAFSENKYLEIIEIPESIINIEDRAFAGCSQLKSLQLPDNLKDIGQSVFLNCENLTDIIIPNDIQCIELGALEGCASLKTLSLPIIDGGWSYQSESTHLGYIFGQEEIYDESCIPDSLTDITITKANLIPDNFFQNCKNLVSVFLPRSLTSIGDYTFNGCNALKEIDIPDSVRSVGTSAFDNTKLIEKINGISYVNQWVVGVQDSNVELTFKEGTIGIASNSYKSFNKMRSIMLPNTIKYISSRAFFDQYSRGGLSEIYIPDSVVYIGSYAFVNCVTLKIYVEAETQPEGWENEWNSGRPVTWGYDFFEWSINDENKIIIDGYTGTATDITIPSQIDNKAVVAINDYAFESNIRLRNVVLPNGIKSIGKGAFVGCSNLKSINVPATVTQIGIDAFNACGALTNIVLPNSLQSLGSAAFYACGNLKEINIPDGLSVIGGHTFFGCSNLQRIIIPSTIIEVGDNAFKGCNNLTIYARMDRKPIGWNSAWNPDNRPVVWGYMGD